jgi:hypothetical protein
MGAARGFFTAVKNPLAHQEKTLFLDAISP